MVETRSQRKHCLDTGGTCFVGRHVVTHLLDTGKCNVTVFDIRDFGDSRVKCIVGDLRKLEEVTKACAGRASTLMSNICCGVHAVTYIVCGKQAMSAWCQAAWQQHTLTAPMFVGRSPEILIVALFVCTIYFR